MPVAPRPNSIIHSIVAVGIIALGAVVSILWFRAGQQEEWERADANFAHRVAVRHALAREILGRYEDSLFGLSALFMLDREVTREEFERVTSRLEGRTTGAQAFEWVPIVAHADRAAMEA